MPTDTSESDRFNKVFLVNEAKPEVRRALRWMVRIALLVGLWFAAVDQTWISSNCATCYYSTSRCEYRVFGVPVSSTQYEYPSWLLRLASDMNAPCYHFLSSNWVQERFWGLIICQHFGCGGFYCDDPEYTADVSNYVRSLAADVRLSEEFQYRLHERRDRAWLQLFYQRVKRSDEAISQAEWEFAWLFDRLQSDQLRHSGFGSVIDNRSNETCRQIVAGGNKFLPFAYQRMRKGYSYLLEPLMEEMAGISIREYAKQQGIKMKYKSDTGAAWDHWWENNRDRFVQARPATESAGRAPPAP